MASVVAVVVVTSVAAEVAVVDVTSVATADLDIAAAAPEDPVLLPDGTTAEDPEVAAKTEQERHFESSVYS